MIKHVVIDRDTNYGKKVRRCLKHFKMRAINDHKAELTLDGGTVGYVYCDEGETPKWCHEGKEIYYESHGGKYMHVTMIDKEEFLHSYYKRFVYLHTGREEYRWLASKNAKRLSEKYVILRRHLSNFRVIKFELPRHMVYESNIKVEYYFITTTKECIVPQTAEQRFRKERE